VLLHAPRQPAAWLTCDVGRKKMSASIIDRKKWVTGWILLGLTAFVAVLLYVRDTREGMLGCFIPASYGIVLLSESKKKKVEMLVQPKRIRPAQWVLIIVCIVAGTAIGYYVSR
jgi:hypothetical protein